MARSSDSEHCRSPSILGKPAVRLSGNETEGAGLERPGPRSGDRYVYSRAGRASGLRENLRRQLKSTRQQVKSAMRCTDLTNPWGNSNLPAIPSTRRMPTVVVEDLVQRGDEGAWCRRRRRANHGSLWRASSGELHGSPASAAPCDRRSATTFSNDFTALRFPRAPKPPDVGGSLIGFRAPRAMLHGPPLPRHGS